MKVGSALNGRMTCHVPSSHCTQYSYCGFGQPVEVAVNATFEPPCTVGAPGLRVAAVQPPSTTALEPVASSAVVSAPCWLAHACTVYVPGGRPAVFQAHVGSVLKARVMVHVPFGDWSQYSNWGLVHPLALSEKLTVDAAATGGLEGGTNGEGQQVSVTWPSPVASREAVWAPSVLAQACPGYVPGASPDVFHVQVGSLLNARFIDQLPFG